ncbi:protein FAM135B-like, partial [Trifolium medium]|nr:protein FAM135B-like [Trifolium medium]
GLPTTAVILKFELMYAPSVENGTDLQDAMDAHSASVHEFRIPPKALLGLHSYCPVHFDALHAALVDVSVHVSLLRAPPYPSALKVPSRADLFATSSMHLLIT